MISFKAKAEALGRTELEIKSEMAATLGRIGSTLALLIADLRQMSKELESRGEKEERTEMLQKYNQLHSRANLYYWYLMVQREAIGITNHDSLRELYPIPAKDLSSMRPK
jgi:hypothetical protein